jgi:hypothetical protein
VLVVVLAVSLITILYYLWSIGTTLQRIRAGLGVVREQTAPLAGHIEAISGALGSTAEGLSGALDDLATTDAALAEVMGESDTADKVA